jgi:hypothetical protein
VYLITAIHLMMPPARTLDGDNLEH